jgi:EAL domain-containing protein (putative c-di-GMP-specific phosphodiesterase class I)
LRHALANDEFEIHYQPIVDMRDGQVHKAEALLRWNHQVRGKVDPGTFIPLAEESGLITEIGEWVFQQAIADIQYWRKKLGCTIQVSVNKSPLQFAKSGKYPWMDTLAKAGLPINSINVEITEGVLIEDTEEIGQQLLEFRNSGIEVSIDDFGTGFSALSYLKQFDIDYLKIDRSFVRDLITNKSDMALTEAIIVMAHKLGIKTIAEGVETQAQRDLLVSFGCDYIQGYLYSRPIPKGEFEIMLGKSLDPGEECIVDQVV